MRKLTRYDILVKNKPGTLAGLTRLLTGEGISIKALHVVNVGNNASIQFLMPGNRSLGDKLRGAGLKINPSAAK